MRAGKTIDSNSGDENLEALNKYGIDLNKKLLMENLIQLLEEMSKSTEWCKY